MRPPKKVRSAAVSLAIALLCRVPPSATSAAGDASVEHAPPGRCRLAARQAIPPGSGRRGGELSLSLDGRFVAFESDAPLTPDDTRAVSDIYVLDRTTGDLTLESNGYGGAAADGESTRPAISGDGRYVAFVSTARNLTATPDGNYWPDVFLRDRRHATTRQVSVGLQGDSNGPSSSPAVSADGRWIAFSSDATNLVAGVDANATASDIYLYSVETGQLSRASVDTDGVQPASGGSSSPHLSADGGVLAFVSTAVMVPGVAASSRPSGGALRSHVYVRDLRTGRVTCADGTLHGRDQIGYSHSPSLSGDGRLVAFVFASQAADRQAKGPEIYLHDIQRSQTTLMSRTKSGGRPDAGSWRPKLSGNGRFLVFESLASNLVCGLRCPAEGLDVNLLPDVYLLDLDCGELSRISRGGAGGEWWAASVAPAIDAAGSVIAFSSQQPATPADVDVAFDLYVWERSQP